MKMTNKTLMLLSDLETMPSLMSACVHFFELFLSNFMKTAKDNIAS